MKKNIYAKLSQARFDLSQLKLQKTGKMQLGGRVYNYFELGDIQPAIIKICNDLNIFFSINFFEDYSEIKILDIEDIENFIIYKIEHPNLKNTENIFAKHLQAIGSKSTYLTRYLLTIAFQISENDATEIFAAAETENQKLQKDAERIEQLKKNKEEINAKNKIKALLEKRGISEQKEFLLARFEEEYKKQDFAKILKSLEEEDCSSLQNKCNLAKEKDLKKFYQDVAEEQND